MGIVNYIQILNGTHGIEVQPFLSTGRANSYSFLETCLKKYDSFFDGQPLVRKKHKVTSETLTDIRFRVNRIRKIGTDIGRLSEHLHQVFDEKIRTDCFKSEFPTFRLQFIISEKLMWSMA